MEWYFRNDQPIYTQLTQQITLAILSGSIPSGGRLPTVRELAAEAGVNPQHGAAGPGGAGGHRPAAYPAHGGALCHGGSVRDPERQGETGPGPDKGVSLVHGAAGLQPAAGESAAGHMGGGITWQFWNAGS